MAARLVMLSTLVPETPNHHDYHHSHLSELLGSTAGDIADIRHAYREIRSRPTSRPGPAVASAVSIFFLGQDLVEPLHIAILHRMDVVAVERGQRIEIASRR